MPRSRAIHTLTHTAIFAGFALAALAISPACGSSSGGGQQADGKSTNATGATGSATGTDSGGGTSGGAGTNSVASTATTTGTETPAAGADTGADPTDQDICTFLNAQSAAILGHFQAAIPYLCSQGGLAALRGKVGQMQTLLNSTDSSGVSHFTLAAALLTTGTPAGAEKLGELFCTNNAQYQSDVGAAAFTNVGSIATSNVTAGGCDFDFKSKPLLVQPEYIGTQALFMRPDNGIFAGFSYMTKSVSLVTDATTISVAAKSKNQVYVYTILTSASPTEGFASVVYQELVEGTTASISGSAQAITTLSQ